MSMRVRRGLDCDGVLPRSAPQFAQASTAATAVVVTVRLWRDRASFCVTPLPLPPGRVAAVSSLPVCEGGILELRLPLAVVFSMKIAIGTSNSISRALNSARVSADILSAADRCSNSAFRRSNSSRSDCRSTVAMAAAQPSSASTAIIAASTARRSARGIAW